jgi:hypothetical protein
MATTKFEGFSVSHAAILDGETGAEELVGDIYGIRTGSVEPDTDSYDNTGDDHVLSTWYWLNFANISITSGYVPFELLALLSGTTVTSSGTAPDDHYSVPLWDEDAGNTPPHPLLIRVPSKDSNGVVRVLDFVFFKVQFQPFGFEGPEYKSGLVLSYSGRAVLSDNDETGTPLTKPALGRLVSSPA